MDTPLITVAEAAKYLGIHPWSVRQRIAAGELPHVRLGRRVLVHRPALDELLVAQARASIR